MFLRWQLREVRPWPHREPSAKLFALLVESVRIGGKPRQRHIASLASIFECDIGEVKRRCRFWDMVLRRLDELGGRVAQDRQRIEKALAEMVPCPTRRQYDQWHADSLALLGPDWVKPALKRWPRT